MYTRSVALQYFCLKFGIILFECEDTSSEKSENYESDEDSYEKSFIDDDEILSDPSQEQKSSEKISYAGIMRAASFKKRLLSSSSSSPCKEIGAKYRRIISSSSNEMSKKRQREFSSPSPSDAGTEIDKNVSILIFS